MTPTCKKCLQVAVIIFALTNEGDARDLGQWAESSPEQREFYNSLQNSAGIQCCYDVDGFDAQWDTRDGKVRVFIDGEPHEVPDGALLTVPNRYGVPRVWYTRKFKDGKPDGIDIRCFLRGTEG